MAKKTNIKPKKAKSEFDWKDTGNLKIRYDDTFSAALRFFPSDGVIAKTLAKFAKKPGISSKQQASIKPPPNKKTPKQGK